ncbi:MAG: glycosyltransferase [Bacteroidetes bacterium]|nr:glycosyltransferase [Bacteroidota bacterium]
MRILQLCKKFPYPLKDGEAIAVTYLAKAFADLGNEVTLLAMNTSKHWFDLNQIPQNYNQYNTIETVFVDNRIRPIPAFLNLFTPKSYHVDRFESPDFAAKLAEMLQSGSFDVVQLESLYLTPYIPVIRRYSKALIALRAHNVEHEIWERVAENSNWFKKWYLRKITPRLKTYEIGHLNDYDLLVGITARDVAHFQRLGLKKPAIVTPIGLDARDYSPDLGSFSRPLSLSFIGSLDWMPNQEGLRWFLDQVWLPLLAPSFPDLHFHIAGRTAPAWIRNLTLPRVHFHGEVPSAPNFINQHSIMVVPLLSGGGMRAKILEGMAVGRLVLSTTLGMEGIAGQNGRDCMVADTPQEFLQAIRRCYEIPALPAQLGGNARQFFLKYYDNQEVGRQLLQEYERNLKGQNVPV